MDYNKLNEFLRDINPLPWQREMLMKYFMRKSAEEIEDKEKEVLEEEKNKPRLKHSFREIRKDPAGHNKKYLLTKCEQCGGLFEFTREQERLYKRLGNQRPRVCANCKLANAREVCRESYQKLIDKAWSEMLGIAKNDVPKGEMVFVTNPDVKYAGFLEFGSSMKKNEDGQEDEK